MEKKITIYDMIAQVIRGNQISLNEEEQLRDVLNGRWEEREKERKQRTLLGILEEEMDIKLKSKEFKPATVKRYKPILRRCFSGSYGNMDAAELTEEILYDFITEVYEAGLSRNEMYMFMRLLKKALSKMNGILKFTPSPNLFINHAEMAIGTRLIECPYSPEEQKAITRWIIDHSSDIRGLACGLWLVGGDGLSPDKIIGLKGQDTWKYCIDGLNKQNTINDVFDFDSNINRANAREHIIQKALSLHPEDAKYVFMVPKKESEGWKKLSGPALQIKMNWICNSLNIPYKPFHGNEAITFDS